MEISKYQYEYEKILAKLGKVTVSIGLVQAFNLCMNNKLLNWYPFEKVMERSYTEPEKYKLMDEIHEKILANKLDDADDLNIFKFKYYNAKTRNFEIPFTEIAKKYFLCYNCSIKDSRMGLLEFSSHARMQMVYEQILKSARDEIVESLTYLIGLNPNTMSESRYKELEHNNFWKNHDEWDVRDRAELTEEILNVIRENESKSADNENTANESNYTKNSAFYYNKFSKQMFIDLIEQKCKDDCDYNEIKRAISLYAEAQSDKSLMEKMENIFNKYAKNQHLREMNASAVLMGSGDLKRSIFGLIDSL